MLLGEICVVLIPDESLRSYTVWANSVKAATIFRTEEYRVDV
jgi:hypothetical protein